MIVVGLIIEKENERSFFFPHLHKARSAALLAAKYAACELNFGLNSSWTAFSTQLFQSTSEKARFGGYPGETTTARDDVTTTDFN